MHTRLAGGGEIPLVGLGTWRLNGGAARDAVGWALDAGYRHIDTATAYGNEQDVGRAIHGSGIARVGVFVTTKMPAENVGRERATLEQSLSAMALDHVDLGSCTGRPATPRESRPGASSSALARTGSPERSA